MKKPERANAIRVDRSSKQTADVMHIAGYEKCNTLIGNRTLTLPKASQELILAQRGAEPYFNSKSSFFSVGTPPESE